MATTISATGAEALVAGVGSGCACAGAGIIAPAHSAAVTQARRIAYPVTPPSGTARGARMVNAAALLADAALDAAALTVAAAAPDLAARLELTVR